MMKAWRSCGPAILLALIASSPAAAQFHTDTDKPLPTPPIKRQNEPLPDGKLQAVAANAKGATFIVVDKTRKTGDVADVWLFNVFDPAVDVPGKKSVSQGLTNETIQCATRIRTEVTVAGYDDAGKKVVDWIPEPKKTIELKTSDSVVAQVVCGEAQLPPESILEGRTAALQFGRDAAKVRR